MSQRWEIDELEWDGLRLEIRHRLVQAAGRRTLLSYSELIDGLHSFEGPHSHALHEMLGEVQRECHAEGLPLVTALAVYRDSGEVGPGFARFAKTLGYAIGNTATARFDFWWKEVARCYAHWTPGS